ncbi:MAG: trehalose-6-phosphate synthase [Gaiellaceae bacterium]
MPPRHNLIVVSNRGPVTYGTSGGQRTARRGGGGLVTALRSLVLHHDVTWIASVMSEEDRVVSGENDGEAFEETARDGTSFRLRLVPHDPRAYDWYYNVVANPMLWFLQHHLWGLASEPVIDHGFHHAWSEGYVAVNRSFADAVLDELDRDPSAAVFFHDYHLYVAPRMVRDARPETRLVHFVHIPWPGTDSWSVLPIEIRRAIHDGLLANDVAGFHTGRWRRNFMRVAEDTVGAVPDWARDALGYEGRRVVVTAAPISVDTAEFDELAQSEAVLEAGEKLARERPEKLILRVDRTDPSKNIVRGFRALELYLDAHPEMHGRVCLLALLDPSRQEIPEYAEYVGAIQREARRVNDRFQHDGWMPIDLHMSDNFPQAVAAYKDFDVLLVNAIFDGLNLIAKEAPLVNERDGVLILSENAGAHEELGDWALSVNPFDVAGQADAIHQALEMPAEERRERLTAIRSWVREHDLAAWIELQLQALDAEELQSPV